MGSLWNRSGTIERYGDDLRAAGAKVYFFQGGTTTPLTVFQDAGESAAHTHPVVADANGRWPDIFIPYTIAYDVRVTSSFDSQLTFTARVPNPNPVDTTVIVPAENQVQTGMIHAEFVNTTKPGYVRLNGLTIGNGASGASERANSDTLALFTYLWNNISSAPVAPGGRGSSASSDFNANKNITLPDLRGTILQGLDDMGNAGAGAFSGLSFNFGGPTSVASSIGANSIVLSSGQMPTHFHTGTTDTEGSHTHKMSASGTTGLEAGHTHTVSGGTGAQTPLHQHPFPKLSLATGAFAPGGVTAVTNVAYAALSGVGDPLTDFELTNHTHTLSGAVTGAGSAHSHSFSFSNFDSGAGTSHSHTFTTSTEGGTTSINNIPLSRLVTWFIKL
jgi:hypothetical protein